jgi:hypothetical protein
VRWNLKVVLICISLVDNEVKHFFMYLLPICAPSANHLFKSLAHVLIGLFVHLVFNFLSSLYILHINHLSDK